MRYDVRCASCQKVFEIVRPMNESSDILCDCGEKCSILISGGEGFKVSGQKRVQDFQKPSNTIGDGIGPDYYKEVRKSD